jgi:hypothetical protein
LQLEPDNENASANLKFLLEEHESGAGALPQQATPIFHSSMLTLPTLGTGLNLVSDAPLHTLMQFTPHHNEAVNIGNSGTAYELDSVLFDGITSTDPEHVAAPFSSQTRAMSSAQKDTSNPGRVQQYNHSHEESSSSLSNWQDMQSSIPATRDHTAPGHGRSINSHSGRNNASVPPSTAASSTVVSSAATSSISSSAENSPPVCYTTYNNLPDNNIPPLHQLQQFNVAQSAHALSLDSTHVNGHAHGARRLSVDTATSGEDDANANEFFDGVAVWKRRYLLQHAHDGPCHTNECCDACSLVV